MQAILQDLRYGLKLLAKSPFFTIVTVLSLAIGIGYSTTALNILNEYFLQSLPSIVKDRDGLVWLLSRDRKYSSLKSLFSYPNYISLKDQNPAFSDIAAYAAGRQFNIQSGDRIHSIQGFYVSGNFFSLLGVQPVLGRNLGSDSSNSDGGQPAAIISHRLWKTFFSGDPAIIGQEILLNRTALNVIGVAPERFTRIGGALPPSRADIYIPLTMQPRIEPKINLLTNNQLSCLELIGRLKPGTGLAQAQAVIQNRAKQFQLSSPDGNANLDFIIAAANRTHPMIRQIMAVLIGAITFLIIVILLIPCSNVASLLLARAIDRRKEIALRAALGASRGRIARQLLTEALVLGSLGGAVGLFLAFWGTHIVAAITPLDATIDYNLNLNGSTLCAAIAISVLASLFFGSIPALHSMRIDLSSALKDHAHQGFRPFRRFGVRNLLVIVNIASSLVVLVIAGLLLQNREHMNKVDMGFKPDQLLIVPLIINSTEHSKTEAQTISLELQERLKSLPGIESTSLAGKSSGGPVFIPGFNSLADKLKLLEYKRVGRSYFQTAHIPFLHGQNFSGSESQSEEAIINETMAEHYWRGKEAIGQQFRLLINNLQSGFNLEKTNNNTTKLAQFRVIGVVKDSILDGYTIQPGLPSKPLVYLPQPAGNSDAMALYIRTTGAAKNIIPAIRRAISDVDPGLSISGMETLSEKIESRMMNDSVYATIMSLLGLLALGLSVMGLYGVVDYTVGRRTHEIGIRVAIGAPKGTVLRLLISEGLLLMAIGLSLGILLAWPIARIYLTGIDAWDPLIYLSVCLLLSATGVGACYAPARKALRADPMVALRCE